MNNPVQHAAIGLPRANNELGRKDKSLRVGAFFASASVSALLLCAGPSAHAASSRDDAAAGAASAETGTGVAEVIVTADRRAENIQKIGTSVSAISSAALVAQNVNTVFDLQYITPSLQITPQFGSGQPVFQIRGVGLTDYASNNAPTVGLYLDEVAYPITFATNGLMYDVSRVEVLRGPQGTLYGRNTTGGAINYIMNKPTKDFTAGVSAQYGSFNSVLAEGYVSGPINDQLQYRLAFEDQGGGAWQTNRETGQKLGNVDRQGVRGILDYEPLSNLKIEVNVHGSHDHSDGNGLYLFTPLTSLNTAHPSLFPVYPADTSRYNTDWGTSPQFASEVGISPTTKPFSHIDTAGTSVRADYNLGAMTLTDLISYDSGERTEYDNFDASSQSSGDVFFQTRADVLENELRLTSNQAAPLKWVTGVYYANQYLNDNYDTGYLPLNGFDRAVRYTQIVNTVSVFGQATYAVTSKLSLTGGLRLEYEKRDLNNFSAFYIVNNAPTNPANTLAHRDTSFTLPSGKLEAQYQVLDNDMAYASVSRGIKSGGFTVYNSAVAASSTTPFKPETLVAYEIGNKLSLPDYKIRFNTSIFYYDYHDEQIQAAVVNPLTGLVGALVNAPKSHLAGGEIEFDWEPIHNLVFSQSAGLAEGKFDQFAATTAVVKVNGVYVGVTTNRRGNNLPAPQFTANGSVEYTWEYPNYNVKTGLEYSDKSTYNSLFGQLYNVAGYALFDAHISLSPKNDRWTVALFGKNIFNKGYDVTRNFFVAGANIALAGEPATWGVRLGLKY
jgi:outer membrane receptor protein involved in Fe transport